MKFNVETFGKLTRWAKKRKHPDMFNLSIWLPSLLLRLAICLRKSEAVFFPDVYENVVYGLKKTLKVNIGFPWDPVVLDHSPQYLDSV